MDEQVDVVVLGLGPGGEDAAGTLADAGLDVVGIDGGLVGGECPYWGCVPSKMMIRAADLLAEGRRIPGMAGSSTVAPDWAVVARRIRDDATDDWDDRAAVERLEGHGARFVRGWGRLDGPGRVTVGDRTFAASRAVLVNPGTRPWIPPVDGLDGTPYWTNREAIEVEELPDSLLVLGGGAIGVELAQVFARFGVAVTVLEVGPRLVPAEEPEACDLLAGVFADEGIDVRTAVSVGAVDYRDGRFTVRVDGGGDVTGDRLLVAAGRRPDLAALGVASVGLDSAAKAIPVDGHLRAAPGLWAIGDVTGKGAFTHVSIYQARIAAADILGRDPAEADYRALPRVTFTDPEIGSVGLTEAQARQAGLAVRVGHTDLAASARGWIHKAGNAGFVKLVEDAGRGVLVGATSAGPCGGEVLGLLALAVHAEVPTARLADMIYAYPTFHRAVEAAVADLQSTDTSWPLR
ncbi:MAG TPA: NAD(P)/FAD-dependent oxidoreductase [Acidimicrobiales bacterium]|nr:NAD(P)/FAD-dependent oxidoreductase [Acidimicrobiales bacterium]